MIEELKLEIEQLIKLFDELIGKEGVHNYRQIRNKYISLLENLSKSDFDTKITDFSIFDIIQNTFRVYVEGRHPNDRNLDSLIMDKMDKIYVLRKRVMFQT